jgi:hypothetical protein
VKDSMSIGSRTATAMLRQAGGRPCGSMSHIYQTAYDRA